MSSWDPRWAATSSDGTIPAPRTWIETVDITNDYLTYISAGYRRNETDKYHLPHSNHIAVGSYLVGSGFVVGLINLLGLLMYTRCPRALLTKTAVPEVALMLSDLCVGGIHPFSGASAIANRWLWGPGGCQLYSFAGFIFGDFQVLVVNFVALDRYITVCQPNWLRKVRTWTGYFRILVVCFVLALVFSVLPLIGYSQFCMLPTKIVCTLCYMAPNNSFGSYLTAKVIVLLAIPYGIGIASTLFTVRRLNQPDPPRIFWAKKKSHAKIAWACLLITPICFSPYPVAAFWALFDHPMHIPRWLVALPPLSAKLAGLFNPVVFLWTHPLHWACLRKTLGLKHNEQIIAEAEAANDAEDEAEERRKARIKELEEAQEMMPRGHKASKSKF